MKRFLPLVLLVLAAFAGCGPYWVNPYFAVEPSQLNWVEIHYYNLSTLPVRRVSVMLDGAGHVEVKKGASSLVSDDFAKSHQDEAWSDISVRRMNVDPSHMNEVFQNLVNFGVLDRVKVGRNEKRKKEYKRFIAVRANINNVTYSEQENIFESDPDLAEQLLDTVRQFDNPTRR